MYKNAIDSKKVELKAQRELEFQKNAESKRDAILKEIEATVPIFWDCYQKHIKAGFSAWWNAEDLLGSGYGVPGIVMWGHLFIGAERDSDRWRLRIGSWSNQQQYTGSMTKIECQPKVSIDAMNSHRIAIEYRFSEGVQEAIHLITAPGNKSSFASWTGPNEL
jgi:hypothetical protein